jgi:SPP1 gp7 family putative phage head morphogenesis protein
VAETQKAITRVGGYYYSRGTAKGFERMKKRGFPPPPFWFEDIMARAVQKEYDLAIDKLEDMIDRSNLPAMMGDAPPEWLNIETMLEALAFGMVGERLKRILYKSLTRAQSDFFVEFLQDAPDKVSIATSFALDKDAVFRGRIDGIKRYYLDTAIEKIGAGQSALRQSFIDKMRNWISGESPDLGDVHRIMEGVRKEAGSFSRFFARDQFSRFHYSLALASYKEIGVKRVQWWTVKDGRVRTDRTAGIGKGHRERHGKIYPIDKIPDRGYNCRCALLAVFDD